MRKLLLLSLIIFCFLQSFGQFEEKIYPEIPNLSNSKSISGDINHDGVQDLIIMGETPDKYITSIFINKGDHFSPLYIPGLIPLSNGNLSLTDFNNDNYLDLLVSGRDKSGTKHTILFQNNTGSSFTAIKTPFEDLDFSSSTWLDYDRDGFLDLLLCGLNQENQIVSKLYHNEKEGTFSEQSHTLSGIYSGCARSCDYDRDGWDDILLIGKGEGSKRIAHLYHNQKGKGFEKIIELNGLSGGEANWGDINNDGYPDLAIAGYDGKEYQSKIFINNKGTLQFAQNLEFPLGNCDLEWLDYDGDEDLDLMMTGGINGTVPKTILYRNEANVFTKTTQIFPDLFSGSIIAADFDGNGKTDLFLNGSQIPEGPKTYFYFNKFDFTKDSPTPPSTLTSETNYPNVKLSWSAGNDVLTPQSALRYRLRVGSSSKHSDFFPFLSNLTNGNSLMNGCNEINCTEIELLDLPEGKYYWAIQTLDAAGNLSVESPEQTFFINTPFDLGEDQHFCYGEKIKLSVPKGNYYTEWYSESLGLIADHTNNLELTIEKDEKIQIKLIKEYGGMVSDEIELFCHPYPTPNLPKEIHSCPGEKISLQTKEATASYQWQRWNGEIIGNNQEYNFTCQIKDTIILKLSSSYGCTSFDTTFVYPKEVPTIDLKNNYYACPNDEISIILNNFPKIKWLNENNEIFAENVTSIKTIANSNKELAVTVTNKEGCSAKKIFHVNHYPKPKAYAGKDTLLCEGLSIKLGEENLAENGTPPYNFQWSPVEHFSNPEEMHPEFSPQKDTQIILKITDDHGCTDKDTVWVKLNPLPIIDAGEDISICPGESVLLGSATTSSNSLKPSYYQWSPSESLDDATIQNPTAKPATTTEYTLKLTNHNCPVQTDKILVTVNPTPQLEIMKDTIVGANQEFHLRAKGANSYKWTPTEPLDDSEIATPLAKLAENTTFSVVGYSIFGCRSKEKEINILVNNEIYTPTLFTPNGDKKNDLFLVYGTGIKELKLRIYNNWGHVVFSSNNVKEIQNTGWNGTFRGKAQPEGSYIWELEGKYSDDRYWKKSGTIYLMR
ncbi:MAG: FG-GAP-like repeat-containing protein [Marinifilaceae bacterium]